MLWRGARRQCKRITRGMRGTARYWHVTALAPIILPVTPSRGREREISERLTRREEVHVAPSETKNRPSVLITSSPCNTIGDKKLAFRAFKIISVLHHRADENEKYLCVSQDMKKCLSHNRRQRAGFPCLQHHLPVTPSKTKSRPSVLTTSSPCNTIGDKELTFRAYNISV